MKWVCLVPNSHGRIGHNSQNNSIRLFSLISNIKFNSRGNSRDRYSFSNHFLKGIESFSLATRSLTHYYGRRNMLGPNKETTLHYFNVISDLSVIMVKGNGFQKISTSIRNEFEFKVKSMLAGISFSL